jgi:ferritin
MSYKIIEKTIREEENQEALFELFKMLNAQYNMEWASAMLYENMANLCDLSGLIGASVFFNKKAEEEAEHAEQFRQFILENNFLAKIENINPDSLDFEAIKGNMGTIIALALEHEKKVTASIEDMLYFSRGNGILKAEPILLKFVEEQVEEEGEFLTLLDNYDIMKTNGPVDFIFDNKLGSSDE